MNTKTYQANKESLKTAFFKAIAIGVAASSFVILMNDNQYGLTPAKGVLFSVLGILFFMLSFFNDSSMRTYQIKATSTGIIRSSYKGCFHYEIKWDDIELIIIGKVLDRYNKWDIWFEGVEINHKSEMGYPDKTVYKLEHLVDADDFKNTLIEICKEKDVAVNDIREK